MRPTRTELRHVVSRMNTLLVGVVGDFVTDEYYVCADTGRCEPEAADSPVLRWKRTTCRSGGAGAVADMAAALGAGVRRWGNTAAVHGTVVKRRVLVEDDSGTLRHVCRMDRESARAVMPDSDILTEWTDLQAIIVSDYGHGIVQPAVLTAIGCLAAANRRLVVAIDPQRRATLETWQQYRTASPAIVTPNRREWLGMEQPGNPDGVMAVTDGPQGVEWRWKYDGPVVRPAPSVRLCPVDVAGAGDQFVTVLTMAKALHAGDDIACYLAQLAAGLQVERGPGVVPVTAAELLAEIDRVAEGEPARPSPPCPAKYLPLSMAVRWREDCRARHERVVFTNGCFDLLHAGHLHLLRTAREMGHRLIVAVNDDAGVRQLKGEGRPIQPLSTRAALLASLECVDAVVAVSGTAVIPLLRELRPDLLVKGQDSREWLLKVGAEAMLEWDGRLMGVPMAPGEHTTDIVERIRRGGW